MKSKTELREGLKSTGTAWVLYWFLGGHYAYIGKWGVQLLYWFTLGGCGVWILLDLFRVNGLIRKYNNKIYDMIEDVEDKKHQQNLEKIIAAR